MLHSTNLCFTQQLKPPDLPKITGILAGNEIISTAFTLILIIGVGLFIARATKLKGELKNGGWLMPTGLIILGLFFGIGAEIVAEIFAAGFNGFIFLIVTIVNIVPSIKIKT
jgi:hypothetical protein